MAKSSDQKELKELEEMIVIVCETLRIASILMVPYTPQLSQGMFERLNYTLENKDMTSAIKFDFTTKLELNRVREFDSLIAKVEDNPSIEQHQ